MDLTKVSSTFPELMIPNIQRDNMIALLEGMLNTGSEIVTIEGSSGIGKTTLLTQFSLSFPHQTITLFARSSSRWAYDPITFSDELCNQIAWVLEKENYRTISEENDLGTLIRKLQRKANSEKTTYYFVVDGLQEIPEEDICQRDSILDLLPFGIPHFRFLLSGPLDCLKSKSKLHLTLFQLAGFTIDETRMFFKGFIEEPSDIESIFRVTKVPGKLASILRLLKSGTNVDKLIDELPERLPNLFDLEWQAVENKNISLQKALAFLAFDQRIHSIDSLSRLCDIKSYDLEEDLNCCNFVEKRKNGQQVEFVSDVFKRFAKDRLSSYQKAISPLSVEF